MSPMLVGLLALGGVVAFLIYYAIDDAGEDLRRDFLQVRDVLVNEFGLEWIPELLENFIIDDKDGLAVQIVQMAKLFRKPDQVALEVKKVFWRIFDAQAKDPGFVAELEAKLIAIKAGQSVVKKV